MVSTPKISLIMFFIRTGDPSNAQTETILRDSEICFGSSLSAFCNSADNWHFNSSILSMFLNP